MGQTPMKFLLDSGAAVSVVHSAVLADCWHNSITKEREANSAVAADGVPLEVLGQVVIPVTLGTFRAEQKFVVVRNLTVDCILGADFLMEHGAIIDCKAKSLFIGDNPRVELDLSVMQNEVTTHSPVESEELVTTIPESVVVPARSVVQIVAHVKVTSGQEGVIEPLTNIQTGIPRHLLVARTLTKVGTEQDVVVQVLNLSPTSTTMHRGMKIGTFVPVQDVHSVGVVSEMAQSSTPESAPVGVDIDLTGTSLTPSQQEQLQNLLSSFHVFAKAEAPLGRTGIVKHGIQTSGSPIRQPLRRLPQALKPVVNSEVQKMLSQGIITNSSSPWCSPVVMVKKKDGSWRLCIDYRKLNSVTRQDAYPLPRIDSTLDSLSGSKYFTTLDLASGYWRWS